MDTSSSTAEVYDRSPRDELHKADWRNHATTTGPGVIGQAIRLDGADDYVYLNDTLSSYIDSGPFTFAIWAYREGPCQTNSSKIMEKKDSSSIAIECRASDNKLNWSVKDFNDISTSTLYLTTMELDQWYHLVGVREGNNIYFYINGELDDSQTQTYTGHFRQGRIRIGHGFAGGNRLFEGVVDDARIYDRALSASEVSRLYGLGATTKINTTITTNPDLKSGLVGHWTFDGGDIDLDSEAAEVQDISGGGNTGDWQSHATTTVSGKIGQAIEFDGTDDIVNITDVSGNLSNLYAFTVAAWIYLPVSINTVGTDATIYASGEGDANFWQFMVDNVNDEMAIRVDDTGTTFRASNSVGVRGWHHVVAKKETGTDSVAFYLDGVYDSSVNIGTSSPTGAGDKAIGAGGDNHSFPAQEFPGSIDDVRVYNRALATSSIQRLYQLGATTKINKTITTNPDLKNGLVGHWTFDGSEVFTQITDYSGNGNTGYLDSSMSTSSAVVSGAMGQGMKFDGSDDVIVIGGSGIDNVHTFSYAFWIYPESYGEGGEGSILSKYWYKEIRLLNGGGEQSIRAYTSEGKTNAANNSISLNEWQHIVVTYLDAVSEKPYIYKNGVLLEEASSVVGGTLTGDAPDNFGIGGPDPAESLTRAFDGLIDDVRIYSRVLSAEEIMRLYELGN